MRPSSSASARLGLGEARDDTLRHDEDMQRGLRIHVVKGEEIVRLGNDASRDFAGGDFFKDGHAREKAISFLAAAVPVCSRVKVTISSRNASQSRLHAFFARAAASRSAPARAARSIRPAPAHSSRIRRPSISKERQLVSRARLARQLDQRYLHPRRSRDEMPPDFPIADDLRDRLHRRRQLLDRQHIHLAPARADNP